MIQNQILQTNIIRIIWQIVRRITNEILEVKGLKLLWAHFSLSDYHHLFYVPLLLLIFNEGETGRGKVKEKQVEWGLWRTISITYKKQTKKITITVLMLVERKLTKHLNTFCYFRVIQHWLLIVIIQQLTLKPYITCVTVQYFTFVDLNAILS